MPVVAATGKHRRRVRFPAGNRSPVATAISETPGQSGQTVQHLQAYGGGDTQTAGLTGSARGKVKIMTVDTPHAQIPSLFRELPAIRDLLNTETSAVQDESVVKCLPFLRGTDGTLRDQLNDFGVARLLRDKHVEYLYDSLELYPENFVGIDSSRPWMVYWSLAGLSLLGEDVTKYRDRVISTFTPMQNSTGGFGGGHGQLSHLASTFPAILCLALVGGLDAYELVDRKAMWSWLGELKQPDGGFLLVAGGEEDVRGAYCAIVTISLLDLPLDLPPEAEARRYGLHTLLSGLPEYLSRCQTFEGGISAKPGAAEAHGAYAFCALACLSILGKPQDTINKYVDVPLLLSWLSARQCAPEGGFSGRTNKLVDGCYSHWVGDCWPLVHAALRGVESVDGSRPETHLYSREGLSRYILNCCQNKNGGLRDKPGKHPDSYHSCYTLTGLSSLQHYHYHTDAGSPSSDIFAAAFSWKCVPIAFDLSETDVNVFDEGDRLRPFHPLYTIPHTNAEALRKWCDGRPI